MPCNVDEYLKHAEIVLRNDLESLARLFSKEEREELWNRVRSDFRKYLFDCSPYVSRDIDKLVKGKFRLAQLILAASFKINNEEYPEIIKLFRDEEYEILLDFEKYKIFDNIDIDDIVEFIRRREGKVYEFVMEYYNKQYNMLDRTWANIIGDLAFMINLRYKHRREKIERAVMEYVRRYGLITTVTEIEQAVKKILEAGELRKRIEEEVRRKIEEEYGLPVLEEKLKLLEEERQKLLERLREVEDSLIREMREKSQIAYEFEKLKAEEERLRKSHETLETELAKVREEIRKAMEQLGIKERELAEACKAQTDRGVIEALQAESEALRRAVEELKKKEEEYRSILDRVSAEKDALKSRLEEIETALHGKTEGRVITSEEARAFEEQLLARLSYKIGKDVLVYDPLDSKAKKIKRWDEVYYYTLHEKGESGENVPLGKGVVYVKNKGVVFKRKEIVIEAITLVHTDSYARLGFDSKAVNLAEILNLLSQRLSEAEKGSYYHLLIISSPTGFTSKAIEFIGGTAFHKNFVAKNVTVYLVDPVEGKVYRHPADKAAIANEEVAKPLLEEEKIAKIIMYLTSSETISKAVSRSHAAPFIRLDEIRRDTGEPIEVIRQAISRLEAEGKGRVKVSPSGEIAFFYNLGGL